MIKKQAVKSLAAALSLALLSSPAFAQELEGERIFSTINVTGNDRFRDRDILVTAGLETGVPYTEADITQAVEALEFTGEFRRIRIFSSGDVLTIAVEEEPDYSGDLTFGLGVDSDFGVFGSASVSLNNILGGKALDAELLFAEEVVIGRASLSGEAFWPGERAGGVRLEYADYDYDNTLFDFQTASLQPYLLFGRDMPGFAGELRLTGLWTDISSVDPDASAIIQAEADDRFVFGPGASLSWAGEGEDPWAIGLSVDIYGGDTSFAETTLSYSNSFPLFSNTVLRTRARVGAVEAFGSDSLTAVDRLTLGGSTMRGFARGGITPADECAGCGAGGGDVITRLGGERYAVLQTDLLFRNVAERLPFTPGLYADVGTVWSLDSPTAPSGILIEDLRWRSSVGIALTAETRIGNFSASYALTTNAEEFDDEQRFNLSFESRF